MTDRFYRWDYSSGIVIQYERRGECNGCGQCCQAMIRYTLEGKSTKGQAPMGNTTSGSGVWSEIQRGKMRRFIRLLEVGTQEHGCIHLTEKGCAVHGMKALTLRSRLALCDAWPMIPEHVALFDQCSYEFVETNRWKFIDNKHRDGVGI